MNPLISVIVPIYNVENYLCRCVDSIINQTYKNLEIILVDDGSPDDCPKICDEYAEKDNRIKVIHKANGGLSDARNVGMEVATGEYICFIDSDDWIDKKYIEVLSDLLVSGADVAICATRLIDENENTILVRGQVDCKLSSVEALFHLVNEDILFATSCDKLYRRSVIGKLKFEKGRIHEDEFWMWKIFYNSSFVTTTSMPLYNYMQRKGSIMGTSYTVRRLDGLDAHVERMRFLQECPELSVVSAQKVFYDCLYHMQCTLKYLKKQDKKTAMEHIKKIFNNIPNKRKIIKLSKPKDKIWLIISDINLNVSARLRNLINIGF